MLYVMAVNGVAAVASSSDGHDSGIFRSGDAAERPPFMDSCEPLAENPRPDLDEVPSRAGNMTAVVRGWPIPHRKSTGL